MLNNVKKRILNLYSGNTSNSNSITPITSRDLSAKIDDGTILDGKYRITDTQYASYTIIIDVVNKQVLPTATATVVRPSRGSIAIYGDNSGGNGVIQLHINGEDITDGGISWDGSVQSNHDILVNLKNAIVYGEYQTFISLTGEIMYIRHSTNNINNYPINIVSISGDDLNGISAQDFFYGNTFDLNIIYDYRYDQIQLYEDNCFNKFSANCVNFLWLINSSDDAFNNDFSGASSMDLSSFWGTFYSNSFLNNCYIYIGGSNATVSNNRVYAGAYSNGGMALYQTNGEVVMGNCIEGKYLQLNTESVNYKVTLIETNYNRKFTVNGTHISWDDMFLPNSNPIIDVSGGDIAIDAMYDTDLATEYFTIYVTGGINKLTIINGNNIVLNNSVVSVDLYNGDCITFWNDRENNKVKQYSIFQQ
jgi:hypothetical protein